MLTLFSLLENHGEHFVHNFAGSSKPSSGSGVPTQEQLTD